MTIATPDQFLRDLAKLLRRDPIVLHKHSNRSEAHDVLEGIDATVRRMTIFIRVARCKEAGAIPRLELTLGQPRQALDVVLSKGRYNGVPAHGDTICLSRMIEKRHFGRIATPHNTLSTALTAQSVARVCSS